jgi:hypothetical protein
MNEGQGWRLLVGLFLTAIVIVWAWSTAKSGLCDLAFQTASQEQTSVPSCLEFWLNRYQTLITGFIALAAAIMTVVMVRQQIRQVDHLEDERRRRESYAARAVLPLALSQISEYAKKSIECWKDFDPDTQNLSDVSVPELPEGLVEPLRDCIRYSEQHQAKQIADLLHWLQVQSSRQRSLRSELEHKSLNLIISMHHIDSAIIDAADLYALASRLFDYGRRAEEGRKTRPSMEEVRTALANSGIWDHERPSLWNYLSITRPKPQSSDKRGSHSGEEEGST